VVSILRKERHVVEHFRQVGAVSPPRAVSLEELHERHGLGLRRLRKRAVIREAQPGRFTEPYRREPSRRPSPHLKASS